MTTSAAFMAGVAGRYAKALFELADESKALDAIETDVIGLQRVFAASADLRALARSPVLSREDQARAFDAVLDKAGASQLMRNFVGFVASRRRLFALSDMLRAYRALLAAHRGEVSAEVASARALNDEQLTALRAQLNKAVGRDVTVETHVDESLLGGLVVKVGSRMIDTSIKSKLARLEIAMKEVG